MSISLSNETMSDGRYIIIIKFNILFLVFVDSDGTSCITPTFSFGANAVNRAYNIKVGMFPRQNSCLSALRLNSLAPLTDDWKVMDNSSVNFHDVFFFILCQIIAKNEEKHVIENG